MEEMPTETGPMRIEFTDPTCIIWAVLALSRLDEMIPSDHEANELFENGFPWPFRARNALFETIRAFCDQELLAGWGNFYHARAESTLGKLKHTATEYYQHSDDHSIAESEFIYLYTIFEAFHRKIKSENPQDQGVEYGALGLQKAVANKLSNIVGKMLDDLFEAHNALVEGDESRSPFDKCVAEQLDLMCAAIEHFIREQADLKIYGDYDTNGNVGEMFARMVRGPLREHIDISLDVMLEDVGFEDGHPVDKDSAHSKAKIAEFLRYVASFFSYASPLLRNFWIPEYDEEDDYYHTDEEEGSGDAPDHVANHQFDNYEDEDWYWEQYEVNTLEDVLPGPENVNVRDVSSVVPNTELSCCDICGDSESVMRKVNLCVHTFCEDCLDQQLKTYHPMRYKCATCRAEFFPRDG